MKTKRIVLTIIITMILSACAVVFIGCESLGGSETEKYSVSYSAEEGGKVYGVKEQIVNGGDNSSAVVAIADSGYIFVSWSDGVMTASRADYKVSADISVTAMFEERYNVNYLAAEHGRIAGKAHQSIKPGDDTESVTAVPDKNYEFVGWSDGNTEIGRKDKNVSNNIEVMALFKLKQYAVEYSADNGYILGNESQYVYHGGMSDSVTAVPKDGYDFVGWSDGVESATRNENNVVNNISITALFTIKEFTVNYIATVGGSLIGKNEQIVSWGESTQIIETVPEYSYKFVGWSDGVTDAVRTDINVQSDIEVTARFEKIGKTVFEYVLRVGGEIQGNTYQEVDYGDQASRVVAIADFGYKFVGWSDGVASSERKDRAGDFVDGKVIIEAIFEFDNPSNVDMFSFSFNSETNSYRVRMGDKSMGGEWFIPDRYNGLPVTEIAESGFSSSKIEYVYIPETIKIIREVAFNNCKNLKRIDGMECVESIGSNAFSLCDNLEYIVLPRTLKRLSGSIIRRCSATVYTRLTEEQLDELNPSWKKMRNEDAKTIYIGNGDIPSENREEIINYETTVIADDKKQLFI